MPILSCIICSKRSQPLTLLTDITLNKCKNVLAVRQKNNLSCKDLVLPTTITENHGYHRTCYQRFTALPPKYRSVSSAENSEVNFEASTSTASSSNVETDERRLENEEKESSNVEVDAVDENNENLDSDINLSDVQSVDTVFDNSICIICVQIRKRVKGRTVQLHLCQKETIKILKSYAAEDDNIDLLHRLKNCESENKEVRYHNCCKKDLLYRIQSKNNENREKTEWHQKRHIHKTAFEVVSDYVLENVINLGKYCFLNFLKDMYIEYVKTKFRDFDGTIEFRDLEDLLKLFPRKIAVVMLNKKNCQAV
ncbi:hypothetical protein ALC57_06391 [Trachymyrmex cornetzi]|uniref:Uncharacterized protein n=1 Tax=Trachymyrmex cornetzi TaxID=471704 RepID=A0A151J8P6_9HYME|nr:hypothetical protein ALC57_06391 [Trachymyrmex cornetzi]